MKTPRLVLLLKAAIPGGAHADLFATPVQVTGHTTAHGTYVAPYQATRRMAAAAPAPALPAPPAPAPAGPATLADVATVLQTTPKNLPRRVANLKLGDDCNRCLGSGHYSYNQTDGSKCYGCAGLGQTFPKNLDALKGRALECVASGTLAKYQEDLRAMAVTKGACDRVHAAWSKVEALNGANKVRYPESELPQYADMQRRNSVCFHACERVDMAFKGYSTLYNGRRKPPAPPLERERVLNEALAEIEAVHQELLRGQT